MTTYYMNNQASTSRITKTMIPRSTIHRYHYDTHDRLVATYFSQNPIDLYEEKFLWRPTYTNVVKLYACHDKKHEFSGILGSIDCRDWPWANSQNVYRAQYCWDDHVAHSFILLEVVDSQDLLIWHVFFGIFKANNDINIIRQSHIFNNL